MAGFYENNGDPQNIFTPAAKDEADRAADEATAAALSATNAATSEANAATSAANAATSESNAATSEATATAANAGAVAAQAAAEAAQTAAETAETNAASSESTAVASASAASTSETNAATSASNASTSETNAAASAAAALVSEGNASTSAVNAAASEAAAAASAAGITQTSSMSRNQMLNQNPISQGLATRVGFSATTYSGNETGQSISTGVDMSTGDFGGLAWIKSRSGSFDHALFDTVRGATARLFSSTTGAETSGAGTGITSFDADGFTLGDGSNLWNDGSETYISWSWQTTDKTTGTTNQNKAYTAHYNAEMGFSIVGYEGSGTANHEIPHHLGAKSELTIWKDRDNVTQWIVQGGVIGDSTTGDYLALHLSNALANSSNVSSTFLEDTVSVDANTNYNGSGNNYIQYSFRSIEGVSKVGKYIGTGANGNYVDCGFKPAFVLVKNLSSAATDWVLIDSARGDFDLRPNLSNADNPADQLDFADDGFVWKISGTSQNALNDEYLFLAFADTNATTGRTDYSYPTTDDTLTINGLASFAEGFSSGGETNNQENLNTTFSLGTGFEDKKYYLYKDKGGSFGVTEYRPLEEQDYSGVPSPLGGGTRTTAKHFDYESSTGVASASSETTLAEAYVSFTKTTRYTSGVVNGWLTLSGNTTGWLQYKHNEPRILKSWRFSASNVSGTAATNEARTPRRFTIEGSNDGLNWTIIDATYQSSDYTDISDQLWGALQDTSGNTTAYLYHRINITANNGDVNYVGVGEMEFNTITPSDRYDLTDGVIYNNAGTPITRVYLGEFRTDTNGDVINNTIVNYTPNKAKIKEAEIHGDLTVRGEIDSKQVATAWVSFDVGVNPPLILDSYNVADVVDNGTGLFEVVFETPMDNNGYSWTGTAHEGNVGVTGATNDTTRLKESVGVAVYIMSNGTLYDSGNPVSVTVFGGKD